MSEDEKKIRDDEKTSEKIINLKDHDSEKKTDENADKTDNEITSGGRIMDAMNNLDEKMLAETDEIRQRSGVGEWDGRLAQDPSKKEKKERHYAERLSFQRRFIGIAAAVAVAVAVGVVARTAVQSRRWSSTASDTGAAAVSEVSEEETAGQAAEETEDEAAESAETGTETFDSGYMDETATDKGNAAIGNPWTDYDSLSEAEKGVGISLVLPEKLISEGNMEIGGQTYHVSAYRGMEGLLEIDLENKDGTSQITIRKGKTENSETSGSGVVDSDTGDSAKADTNAAGDDDVNGDDIGVSGDYNEYSWSSTAAAGDNEVTLGGLDEQHVNLAVWQSGEYDYSVDVNPGTENGLTEKEMISLAEQIG